jgi:hypothetical protein
VSLRQELIEAGYDPDAENTRGYVCKDCGCKPTELELDMGICEYCAETKREVSP